MIKVPGKTTIVIIAVGLALAVAAWAYYRQTQIAEAAKYLGVSKEEALEVIKKSDMSPIEFTAAVRRNIAMLEKGLVGVEPVPLPKGFYLDPETRALRRIM